jgi:hypothetical protein
MPDNETHNMAREDETWVDEDGVQNGVDDNATGDAEKGATLGGIGGALTGLAAGAMAGPIGAVAGAVIGGIAGAVASGAAVAAVDRVDNDNTVSGVGAGTTYEDTYRDDLDDNMDDMIYPSDRNWTMANANDPAYRSAYNTADNTGMNQMPGERAPSIKTGGYANDGTPDTRGVGEKIADAVTGDDIDDKTGKVVDHDSILHGTDNAGRVVDPAYRNTAYTNDPDSNVGMNRMQAVGEDIPSVKTGGYANDGTPDTRGVAEKVADAVTGDAVDDKTGKIVKHP